MLAKLKTSISSVTDVDLKAKLSVIYCLGCMYTGSNKEAAAVSSYLERKYPDDSNLKYLSKEYISDTCAVCGGSGSVQTNCTSCNGSGKCSVCKGSGTTTIDHVGGGHETVKCSRCHGTGKCQLCNGTGKISATCTSCNGTGCKLSKNKIKNVYTALLRGETPNEKSSAAMEQAPATSNKLSRSGIFAPDKGLVVSNLKDKEAKQVQPDTEKEKTMIRRAF